MDEGELIEYEQSDHEQTKLLALNILWSSLMFLLAMIA
jgi:hypothetical protein